MNTDNKIPWCPSYLWHLMVLIVTTVIAIAVSLYCLNAGRYTVFQNLFYFPIIIACVSYLKKGFVFSVLLAFFYLFLIFAYTDNSIIICEAFIRAAIFIMVAGVVLFQSMKRRRSEDRQNRFRSWQEGINRILGLVLEPVTFDEKLKHITDGVVETFGADFCRIWIIEDGDLCGAGCMHADVSDERHICRYRDKCLHLKASSGRYTHIDGEAHRRVPFGAYKIGRIASGEEIKFLTNDVQHDPRVHDREWAKRLGLAAFAGYRLQPRDGETLGVFALFANFEISPDMDTTLEGLSRALALAIQKDIAERARAESEGQYRTLFETANDAIWLMDGERFIACNPRAVDMLGYQDREEVIHRTPIDFSPEKQSDGRDSQEKALEFIRAALNRKPQNFYWQYLRKDGTPIDVEVSLNRLKLDGKVRLQAIGRDITKRKQADEALIRIQKAVESSSDAIGMSNPQGSHFYQNKAFLDLFEYSVEELNKPLAPIVMYADPEVGREVFETIMRGNPWIGETVMAAKSGRRFPAFLRADAVKDDSGNIIGLIGIHTDITERKLAEQRLNEEMDLKNFLLDLNDKAPALTDKDLYDYVLDHVVRLTGSTIGFFHLVSDDQKNVVLTTWNKAALENCTASYATHYPLDQAGNWVDCVRFKRPVVYNEYPSSPNQKGLPEGHTPIRRFMSIPVVEGDKVMIIFGVGDKTKEYSELDAIHIHLMANDLQKIMARRRAEAALSSSEAYFRSLIENASDIITIVDDDGSVRYISPSLERVTGLKTSEVTGKNIFEYVHPDDETAAKDVFTHVIQNPGGVLSSELRMRHDGSSWHVFEIIARNLLQNEAVKGIVVNSHDITLRKEAEREREKLILELRQALSEVKTLSGMLPICAWCKKIRNDKGYWEQVEAYVGKHSNAQFSHGICPECLKKQYPEYQDKIKKEDKP